MDRRVVQAIGGDTATPTRGLRSPQAKAAHDPERDISLGDPLDRVDRGHFEHGSELRGFSCGVQRRI